MAYIYLEELKEHLPIILSDWIEPGDESWEWIFQEIEQKCHVGKKRKKKKKFDKEEHIRRNRVDIDTLINKFQQMDKDLKQAINNNTQLGLSMKDMGAEIRHMRDDVKAAKSMAETAKQRTEIDYSKYSGKSDGKISYCNPEDIEQWRNEHESDRSRFNNKCASCKHKLEESLDQPCVGCCYNGINISGIDKWEAKENE